MLAQPKEQRQTDRGTNVRKSGEVAWLPANIAPGKVPGENPGELCLVILGPELSIACRC